MDTYIYIKNTEDISSFKDVININKLENITVIAESRRSFRELEKLKNKMSSDDILIINDSSSLGLNEADISNQLEWFIKNSMYLIICSIEATYIFGISQPINKAILTTILQTILNSNTNIVKLPVNRHKNSGRNKINYPDNWEELYILWTNKVITSKEFLNRTGLKKATFYNLLTDYKEMQKDLEFFQNQYKIL
jgi:sugar-specific transcriptional regulator TrmB